MSVVCLVNIYHYWEGLEVSEWMGFMRSKFRSTAAACLGHRQQRKGSRRAASIIAALAWVPTSKKPDGEGWDPGMDVGLFGGKQHSNQNAAWKEKYYQLLDAHKN